MATKIRTTPGVYITEVSAFPPSIVGVPTAIPGFIGYTEKAEVSGKPMFYKPIFIRSMADFELYFGGAYRPLYDIEAKPSAPITNSFSFDLTATAGDFAGAVSEEPTPPPDADDYDFKVLDTSTSPPEWHLYKLKPAVAVESPITSEWHGASFGLSDAEARFAPAPDENYTEARFNLYNSMRLFYANGGGECWVVSAGSYDDSGMKVEYDKLKKGLDAMAEQSGPTMLVCPDLVLLDSPGQDPREAPAQYGTFMQDMLKQCAKLQDRVAILDVFGSANVKSDLDLTFVKDQFRKAVGEEHLNYGMGYFPFLLTSVIEPTEINYQNISAASMPLFRSILDTEADTIYANDAPRRDRVKADVKKMEARPANGNSPEQAKTVKTVNQNLMATLPLLGDVETNILIRNSVLPASGAMAGVYTRVDNSRGVWNAPANVTLTSVLRPTYKMNSEQQGDFNVPVDGKAIDVIREFTGRGSVVWGARTLDGNSADYRYIQVRRTLVFIEQSVKAALQPFVFAPNDGNTWTTVVAMISSFLQGVWAQGGLMGSTASEAFQVQCGVGSTMTSQDVLDGYMRVQIVLQMLRPAEFIELTFTQKMEGAA